MPKLIPTVEVETIRNVVANFDWTILKQEITPTEIKLTIQKVIVTTPQNTEVKPE